VARSGHPSFPGATAAAILSLLLWSAAVVAAPPGNYRLAGVVAVGKDYLGFLELPNGTQVLVRQGSTIEGGGRIVALNGEGLRIAFPNGTVELGLEGSGAARSAPMSVGTPVGPPDDEHLALEVDSAAVSQALKTSRASDAHADAGVEVGRRFAAVANLPNNARVLAVNEVPVTSADKAIRLAEKSLADGSAVILNVAAASGHPVTRVYLLPASR